MFSATYAHCYSAVFSALYGDCHSAVFSALYGDCHSAVFSALYGDCHSAVFSTPYDHCHSALFTAPYGQCPSAPYRRSPVVMNVPGPRIASRQNHAAASHSRHFNTVLYPISYSQCQLPLNRSCRYTTRAAPSVQNYHKPFAVTTLSSLHLCRPVNIYTGCPRRNVPDFGRVFFMLKYTDITQNTYVQS